MHILCYLKEMPENASYPVAGPDPTTLLHTASHEGDTSDRVEPNPKTPVKYVVSAKY